MYTTWILPLPFLGLLQGMLIIFLPYMATSSRHLQINQHNNANFMHTVINL